MAEVSVSMSTLMSSSSVEADADAEGEGGEKAGAEVREKLVADAKRKTAKVLKEAIQSTGVIEHSSVQRLQWLVGCKSERTQKNVEFQV